MTWSDGVGNASPGPASPGASVKHLFELFAETLDELCRIGSSYEDAPGV